MMFSIPPSPCMHTHIHTRPFLVPAVFCWLYCYSAVFRERQFELLAFISAIAVILIYIIGNYIFDVVKSKEEGHEHTIAIIKTVRVLVDVSALLYWLFYLLVCLFVFIVNM